MPVIIALILLSKPPYETNPVSIVLDTGLSIFQKVFSSSQGDVCNFTPSCSRFARRSIQKCGPLWGILMTSDRLLRCNPFAHRHINTYYGGIQDDHIRDPVEQNYIFHDIKKNDTCTEPTTLSDHDY